MFRNQAEHVVVSGLGKRYGTATVLNSVDLTIRRGEIHALVGENGAGKSTLSKIIAGVVRRDAGHVSVDGRPVSYRDPAEALRDGLTLIAQEVALAPALSVVANVFLGNESSSGGVLRSRNLHQRYVALNAQLNFNIPARVEVRALPFGDQQKVEIMRALARESKLIILDEPTASLGQEDKEVLFRALRDLRERGKTIVYISHHLDEVLALADSVTIMRDGRVIRSGAAAEESEQTLIQGMLGRSLESIFPDKHPPAPDSSLILETRALSSRGRFADVDLQVRAGEIVGLAGLVGAGRSEVARAIFGADAFDSGRVLLHGREVRFRSPRAASRRGIGMVPESRRDQGLVLPLSTNENLTIVALPDYSTLGVIRAGRLRAAARAMISRLDIRTKNPRGATAQLSGGNQQKVLFGKWLMAQPQLLIVDEPTRGVDVGAKQAIYDLIAELAASGVAILLISSELEEVLGLSHRVIVMREGRVSASLGPGEVSETAIMSAAFLPHSSSTPGGSS